MEENIKTFKQLPVEVKNSGKFFCSVDLAQEGAEVCVEGYMYKGKYYIISLKQG